jgi:copper(I)-binding protein
VHHAGVVCQQAADQRGLSCAGGRGNDEQGAGGHGLSVLSRVKAVRELGVLVYAARARLRSSAFISPDGRPAQPDSLQRNQGATMKRITAAVLLLAALPVMAQVTVKDPWVRATVSQQKATGAFMQITSAQDAQLVAASSPVAGVVEVHEMTMEKDVMKMRAMKGLDLPAGKSVELKPGGYHVMLMDLKQQMKEGDTVPMTLVVEGKDKKRSTIEVKAAVKALTAQAKPADPHSAHKH